ncbi:MAG: nucleotidyltransferase domain-containing protein [Bacteroidetes bacterium]|nr:nucleotidyltransferase domain-containing protein [Bacteroidota bacterium]
MDEIGIIKELKRYLLERQGDNLIELILFGSRSKGIALQDSDYDILLITRDKTDWIFRNQLLKDIYSFELNYQVFIDIHILSLDEVEHSLRGRQPIFKNAIKNGIRA